MTPAYDRELIADMLDGYGEHTNCDMGLTHFGSAIAEQARLLREADNAEAASVGTVAASEDGLLPCPFCGAVMVRDFNGACFVHPNADAIDCPARYMEGYTSEEIAAWNRRLAASGQGVDSVAVAKAIHEGLRRNGTTVLYSGAFERIVAQAIAAAPTQEKA